MTVRTPQAAAFAVLTLCAWVLRAGLPGAPVAGGAQAGTVSAKATPRAESVPETVGLWTGRPLEVDHRARELLETEDVTLMEYRLGQDQPVWLAHVAGFGKRAAFHPPELCYVGSRFEILEREPVTVLVHGQAHRLMRLVIAQDGQRFEAWYWFTANGRVTPNYYQQQLWLVSDAVRREPTSSGTLVRISTPLDDPEATHRRLLAFLTSFESAAPNRHATHDGL